MYRHTQMCTHVYIHTNTVWRESFAGQNCSRSCYFMNFEIKLLQIQDCFINAPGACGTVSVEDAQALEIVSKDDY